MVGTLVLCRLSWLYFEKPMIQLGREVQFRSAPALISGFRLNDQLISVGFQPAQPSRTYVRPLVRIIPNRAVRIDGAALRRPFSDRITDAFSKTGAKLRHLMDRSPAILVNQQSRSFLLPA